jgi:23S rRNA pseudouridine1911/1915/1917 synthase
MTIVEAGKEASTKYKVREYLGNYTLIEVVPLTGRTHQIRVHMSAIGYPVAGDAVYGVKVPFLNRQFVHAHHLGFHLPSNNQYREFTSSLPEDLKQALQYLAAISRDSFTLG